MFSRKLKESSKFIRCLQAKGYAVRPALFYTMLPAVLLSNLKLKI